MIYLDTSVLAAYYLPEIISERAQGYIQVNKVPTISELTKLEFFSALSIRVRTNTLNEVDARRVMKLFEKHMTDNFYLLKPLESKHYSDAGNYIRMLKLPLKAADALYLAFCNSEKIKLVTADKQLSENASKLAIDNKYISSAND